MTLWGVVVGATILVVLAMLMGLAQARVLIWVQERTAEQWRETYRLANDAGQRAAFGMLTEPIREPESGDVVRSSDQFEEHDFAKELVVTPEERARLLGQLTPWDDAPEG